MAHFHAVVWIDHKQARILHFSADDFDRTVVRPDHATRDISRVDKRTGHRLAEDHGYFEHVASMIADAGAILIVGPADEKTQFMKYLREKHPKIEAHVEGVKSIDHPTDGELVDFARRYLKAADRMRPQS